MSADLQAVPDRSKTGGWLALTLASVVVQDLTDGRVPAEIAEPLLIALINYADVIDPEPGGPAPV